MKDVFTFNYGVRGRTGGFDPPYAPAAGHGRIGGGTPRPPQDGGPHGRRPLRGPTSARHEQLDWGYLGLMAFTALLFFRPQDHFPALQLFNMAEIAAIVALGSLGWQRLSRNLPLVRMTPELMGLFALGALMAITLPFSIWPGGALNMITGYYLKIVLIFVLMVDTVTSPRRLRLFTWLILIAAGYLAFRAVLDYVLGVNVIGSGRVRGAVGGIFRNPNDLALNMVAFLPLAVFLFLERGRPARRYFAGGLAAFMLAAVICTQSRGGTVGLAVMLAVLAIHALKRRPGLAVALGLALLLALPLVPSAYWARVQGIFDPAADDTGSREARKRLQREAIAAILERPLTGVGVGQFVNYNPEGRDEAWRQVHNVVLQFAADLGIFGAAIFLFLVARAFWSVRWTRRQLEELRRAAERRLPRGPTRLRAPPPVPAEADRLPAVEREWLHNHSAAMSASLAGWFACALFAPVAYNWTFYYLLALAMIPRLILEDHARAAARQPAARATAGAET